MRLKDQPTETETPIISKSQTHAPTHTCILALVSIHGIIITQAIVPDEHAKQSKKIRCSLLYNSLAETKVKYQMKELDF